MVIKSELGDLLFAVVNLARFVSVNADEALSGTINRFESRFSYLEDKLKENKVSMKDASLEQMDLFWEEAKVKENNKG